MANNHIFFSINKEEKSLSDIEILMGIKSGDQRIQTRFYLEYKKQFEKSLFCKYNNTSIKEYETADDIYNTSFMRLYYLILDGKLFEKDEKLFCTNAKGETAPLSGSLGNYLSSIGKNVFMELYRDWKKRHTNETSEDYDLRPTEEERFYNDIPETFIKTTNIDGQFLDADTGEALSYDDLSIEDRKSIIIWDAVEHMKEPCNHVLSETLTKEITGRSDIEIAELLGFKNADVVKSKRNLCQKKLGDVLKKQFKALGII